MVRPAARHADTQRGLPKSRQLPRHELATGFLAISCRSPHVSKGDTHRVDQQKKAARNGSLFSYRSLKSKLKHNSRTKPICIKNDGVIVGIFVGDRVQVHLNSSNVDMPAHLEIQPAAKNERKTVIIKIERRTYRARGATGRETVPVFAEP